MANSVTTARTNYFTVTDEGAYNELFTHLVCGEDKIYDFTKEIDGIVYHGFGAYDSIDYVEDFTDEDREYNFDAFCEKLQKILPDKEAVIYTEISHTKLSDVGGFSTVITKERVEYIDLHGVATRICREIFDDADWVTKLNY